MSGDLKERLLSQAAMIDSAKTSSQPRRYRRAFSDTDTGTHRAAAARIEQLEAQLAEEKAKHALTIQQSDHFSAQLDTAADLAKDRNLQLVALHAQLAAAREALDVFLRHCRTDMSRKAQDALNAVRAALATAPATDGGDNEDHG